MNYLEKIVEIIESDNFMVLSDCVVTRKDNNLYVVPNTKENVYDIENIKVLKGDNIFTFCTKYATEIDFAYNELSQVKQNNEVKKAM